MQNNKMLNPSSNKTLRNFIDKVEGCKKAFADDEIGKRRKHALIGQTFLENFDIIQSSELMIVNHPLEFDNFRAKDIIALKSIVMNINDEKTKIEQDEFEDDNHECDEDLEKFSCENETLVG